MKHDYSVIYNGKFYRAGEEVPVRDDKKIADNAEVKNKKSDSRKLKT